MLLLSALRRIGGGAAPRVRRGGDEAARRGDRRRPQSPLRSRHFGVIYWLCSIRLSALFEVGWGRFAWASLIIGLSSLELRIVLTAALSPLFNFESAVDASSLRSPQPLLLLSDGTQNRPLHDNTMVRDSDHYPMNPWAAKSCDCPCEASLQGSTLIVFAIMFIRARLWAG